MTEKKSAGSIYVIRKLYSSLIDHAILDSTLQRFLLSLIIVNKKQNSSTSGLPLFYDYKNYLSAYKSSFLSIEHAQK